MTLVLTSNDYRRHILMVSENLP